MVPREGLEPTHLQEVADFKSAASTIPPPRRRRIHIMRQRAGGGERESGAAGSVVEPRYPARGAP